MPTVLLTFLGRVPRFERGYRATRYDFGDGLADEPVAFFGWPLQRRVRADRLVVLGTAGSMWDHLFEEDISTSANADDAQLALLESLQDAVADKAVTPAHLDPLAPLLEARFGCDVRLALIPYCRNETEQVALLRVMAAHVGEGERVELDVTHGFRHLPMLAVLAALHLRVVRRAEIGGVWYGAFDPETGEAPVHNLVGVLQIADWIEALHTYDKDGDYGVFAPLLGGAGELLRKAAFFERTSNPVKAREALTAWASRPDQFPPGDPAAELFREELQRRVSWYRGGDRAAWEAALAHQYLDRGDYVRASIYGLESVITAEVARSKGDVGDYDERDQARGLLKNQDDFRTLEKFRNALAHGVRPFDKAVAKRMKNQQTLDEELRRLLGRLHGVRG